MTDEIKTFPVTGWEIRTVPAYDMIMLTLPFLSHPLQKMEEADPGRNYALTTAQVAELRDALDRALQKMRAASVPKMRDESH